MRTSPTQFSMLITYMEQHGDLNKPTSNARGRQATIKAWEELATLLNSDATGETKSVEKWRKVWSDLKNNTKKKAARIHRAAVGTGGGPASQTALTETELRVLGVMGPQVATGLQLEEAGLAQINESNNEDSPAVAGASDFTRDIPSTSRVRSRPGPAQSRQTTPRRVRLIRGSPRRRVRQTHTEQATQHFLEAQAKWLELKRIQHDDLIECRREENRIRLLEAENRRQEIENNRRAINLLETFINTR